MVVVVDELEQDSAQVALAKGNQMIEALSADCPHPAFRDRVRPRRLDRCSQTLDRQTAGALSEVDPPDAVPVMGQKSRLAVPGCGFNQLPPNPGFGWMGSHLEVKQLTASVVDEEDDVERLEGQGLDDEEVSGPDRLSMVGQESAPALAGRSRVATPAVAAYGARTDHDAELEQLAADALGPPEGVLIGHTVV